jgi:hypothetical protein
MLGEITFFAREVSVTEMAEIMFSGFSLRVSAILLLSLLANLLLSLLALPVQILTQPRRLLQPESCPLYPSSQGWMICSQDRQVG